VAGDQTSSTGHSTFNTHQPTADDEDEDDDDYENDEL